MLDVLKLGTACFSVITNLIFSQGQNRAILLISGHVYLIQKAKLTSLPPEWLI